MIKWLTFDDISVRVDIPECWGQCFSSWRCPWHHSGPNLSTWPTWPGPRSGGQLDQRGWGVQLDLVMVTPTSACLYPGQCWSISLLPPVRGRSENIKLNKNLLTSTITTEDDLGEVEDREDEDSTNKYDNREANLIFISIKSLQWYKYFTKFYF